MNPNNEGKPEPVDHEAQIRLMELELMRQRAERQQAGTPYQGLRVASFIFLFVVILGALAAFYYLMTSGRLEELRAHRQSAPPGQSAGSPSP
jgi:hypothetical protein